MVLFSRTSIAERESPRIQPPKGGRPDGLLAWYVSILHRGGLNMQTEKARGGGERCDALEKAFRNLECVRKMRREPC
jgi:hypothetical protein